MRVLYNHIIFNALAITAVAVNTPKSYDIGNLTYIWDAYYNIRVRLGKTIRARDGAAEFLDNSGQKMRINFIIIIMLRGLRSLRISNTHIIIIIHNIIYSLI